MEPAYTKLARYYDELQQNVDYQKWVELVKYYYQNNFKVLELGCGTGTLAFKLAQEKISVDGFDLSANMISQARFKYPNLNFYVDDMCKFSVKYQYDLIICFMDSFNYLAHIPIC